MNLSNSLYTFHNRLRHYRGEFKNFDPVDNPRNFIFNKMRLGHQWRYSDKIIDYSYNSLGYRSEELEYYKDKDFVLVLGCSHTEGSGLAEDEIWHTQIKKEFGYEILNAGVAGAGADIILINTICFLKNSNLKPKAVIIQWPNTHRFCFKGDKAAFPLLPVFLTTPIVSDIEWMSSDDREDFDLDYFDLKVIRKLYEQWSHDNNSSNHSHLYIETIRLLWKLSNVPYYDFSMDPNFENIKGLEIRDLSKLIVANDFARDFYHYGYLSHSAIGSEIVKLMKNEI